MKTNYLNNRDILKEIHNSKLSYSSFLDPNTHSQFDLIVQNKKSINRNTVAQARAARVARLERETKQTINPKTIKKTDLVFRVMTWEHIPLATAKRAKTKKRSKLHNLADSFDLDELSIIEEPAEKADDDIIVPEVTVTSKTHIKVNFPPFIHYKFNDDNELVVVGKSHWLGDLDSGQFSKSHGQITETLALMIMKLCDRYSTRPNWRGYTYNEEMRAQAILQLSQVCLQFDESKSENPFSYFTMVAQNSFTRILNVEKRNQSVRDDLLEKHKLTPSFTRQNRNANLD